MGRSLEVRKDEGIQRRRDKPENLPPVLKVRSYPPSIPLTCTYELIERGEIPRIRLGRSIRIPRSTIKLSTSTAAIEKTDRHPNMALDGCRSVKDPAGCRAQLTLRASRTVQRNIHRSIAEVVRVSDLKAALLSLPVFANPLMRGQGNYRSVSCV